MWDVLYIDRGIYRYNGERGRGRGKERNQGSLTDSRNILRRTADTSIGVVISPQLTSGESLVPKLRGILLSRLVGCHVARRGDQSPKPISKPRTSRRESLVRPHSLIAGNEPAV